MAPGRGARDARLSSTGQSRRDFSTPAPLPEIHRVSLRGEILVKAEERRVGGSMRIGLLLVRDVRRLDGVGLTVGGMRGAEWR